MFTIDLPLRAKCNKLIGSAYWWLFCKSRNMTQVEFFVLKNLFLKSFKKVLTQAYIEV